MIASCDAEVEEKRGNEHSSRKLVLLRGGPEDIGTVLCEAGPRSCAHAPQAGRLQFHLESGEWAPCTSEAKRLRGQSSLNANQRCSTKSSSLQMLLINLG